MLSKNQQKFISSLAQKKYREEAGFFVVEGVKGVGELLASDWEVDAIYATSDWLFTANSTLLKRKGCEVTEVSNGDLERITQLKTPNQVLALAKMKVPPLPDLTSGFILALDKINDPGNLGTIIRIADWFGISAVVCSPETADCYNSKVVQSTMGSIFRVPVIYQDLESLLKQAGSKKVPVYLAEMNGTPLNDLKFGKSGIIVMGSESHGVNPALQKLATVSLTIPRVGNAESLNVGVAAGIICSRI